MLPDRIFVLTDQNVTYSQQKMSFRKKNTHFRPRNLIVKISFAVSSGTKAVLFFIVQTPPRQVLQVR